MILPITLSAAAAAALVVFWLSNRVVRVRMSGQIAHGDGANALLSRRMRAQLNFTEYTPFVLILCAAIELSGSGGIGLAVAMAVYIASRIAHALGMDSEGVPLTRKIGMVGTYIILLGLAIYAALIAGGVV